MKPLAEEPYDDGLAPLPNRPSLATPQAGIPTRAEALQRQNNVPERFRGPWYHETYSRIDALDNQPEEWTWFTRSPAGGTIWGHTVLVVYVIAVPENTRLHATSNDGDKVGYEGDDAVPDWWMSVGREDVPKLMVVSKLHQKHDEDRLRESADKLSVVKNRPNGLQAMILETPVDERSPALGRARIQQQIMESPAWGLNQRLMLFELSLELFKRNYAQLRDKIDAHLPTDATSFVKTLQNHPQIREDQIEITRLLHNFVAAVKSLVDHTRRLYDKLYKPTKLMPDYPDEIKKRFADNELAQFVEGLRNYCMHYQLPPIHSIFGMDIEKGLSSTVCLSREELLKWDSWEKGKEYLKACPAYVPFPEIMDEYYQKVIDFYGWFVTRQRAIHAEEIALLDELRAKMNALRDEGDRRAEMRSTFEEIPLEQAETAVAAYYIWEKDGREHGKHDVHWSQAIRELRTRKVMKPRKNEEFAGRTPLSPNPG